MIVGLHHAQITIPPGTEREARAFYCGVLGLEEVPKPQSLVARGGFWLQLGPAQVHVGVEEGVDRTKTKAHVAYEVTDLDRWRGVLVANGFEISEGIPIPDFARLEFRDPFGNRVELIQEIE